MWQSVNNMSSSIVNWLNATFDSLVGLEYLNEVITGGESAKANYFVCILCDEQFASQETILQHMNSFKHRVEYLVRSDNKKINNLFSI